MIQNTEPIKITLRFAEPFFLALGIVLSMYKIIGIVSLHWTTILFITLIPAYIYAIILFMAMLFIRGQNKKMYMTITLEDESIGNDGTHKSV